MRNLIDILDLSVEELDELIKVASDIIDNPSKYAKACEGKQLATLFFEPSTRTRMSFESAMNYLGGKVITVAGANTSSAAKGESIADTIKVVSNYVDIIAMRHRIEGAALVAANNTTVPFINAGDGGHFHPTQTLADLLTIYRESGRLDNLTVGICGDLKYGRTVHSLIAAMSRYENVKFVLISPEELKCPEYVFEGKDRGSFEVTTSLEEAMPKLDILYMTRIQKERFTDEATYERLKDSYILTPEKLLSAKPEMRILHPLPRVNEISVAVDDDPRAVYFKQTLYGRYMRMALILKLLKEKDLPDIERENDVVVDKYKCTNPVCITSCEQELKHKAIVRNGKVRCLYCEHDIKS